MSKDRMDREERKQLRGPDEFVTTAANFLKWAENNMRTVVMAVAGVLAIVIGIGVFNSYQSAQLREANADLASGLDSFRGGEYGEAAVALGGLAARDGASSVAPLAAVVAANSQLRAGDHKAAIASLRSVEGSALPRYLRQQRLIVWGNALEAKGDLEAAAAKYEGAAMLDGPYTGDALVAQARAQERNGDAAGAAELYKKALRDFPERLDRVFLESRQG